MVAATAAFAMLVMMLMVVVAAAAMVLLFLMVMMTTATVMLMVMFMFQRFQSLSKGVLTLHSCTKLFSCQFTPRRGNQRCIRVMLTKKRNRGIQLCLRNGICTGKDDGGSGFDLIVVELAKVLHVYLDLACIHNRNRIAKGHFLIGHLLDSSDHIGKLANTGGFDDDTVRVILLNDLSQRLAEITHQRAADTAGVHLRNVDTGILQESAVNADLTELIFDKHQLLALVGFLDHLLDESRFSCAKKSGIDINLHKIHLLYKISILYYTTIAS